MTTPEIDYNVGMTPEAGVAFSGPAVFCNRFLTNVTSGGEVRIAFMEGLFFGDGGPSTLAFRSAVMLSYTDVVALRDVLGLVVKTIDEQAARPDATNP